ncbi:MAG: PqqD family protein [Clostridia bacterium]|nr:PqqD family protein [Clostridia bacterium]
MKTKSAPDTENYLERTPLRHPSVGWSAGEDGLVTLEIENTGWANRLAQKLFHRPKISYVHLDEMGSFIWPLLSEERDIIALGKLVEERFGEAANPLYERLSKYIGILESYHFILWK